MQRGWCIEQLAAALREWDVDGSGIDCPALHILAELESFIRREDGREEAAPGKHDDWVLALCIAMATKDGATLYHLPTQLHAEPGYREKQRLAAQKAKRGSGGFR